MASGRRERMVRSERSYVQAGKKVLVGAALCILVLAAGCGTLDQGPGVPDSQAMGESGIADANDLLAPDAHASGHGGFFPLDIGNLWTYSGELTVAIEPGDPIVTERLEVHSIIGTEELFGREYVLEKQFNIDEDGDTLSPYWVRYRQDRAGLYEADVAGSEPPSGTLLPRRVGDSHTAPMARIWNRISPTLRTGEREAYKAAWEDLCLKLRVIDNAARRPVAFAALSKGPPGGVMSEEITRLEYPLHPGQEWTIRDDPFYVLGACESHDVLDLPPGRMPGYKIAITNDLLGPNDWVYVWYGRRGFLGSEFYVETEIIDPNGNPMGTLVAEEHLFLESLDLVGKGRW
jgi:hypothetical protein